MRPMKVARASGTGASVPVEFCQVCGHAPLDEVLSLGYMPPVNQMVPIGVVPRQQPWFPTNLLYCRSCELVQLGLAVDPVIIFPPDYPYTSGTTRLLRDNFADLARESAAMLGLGKDDLVVDGTQEQQANALRRRGTHTKGRQRWGSRSPIKAQPASMVRRSRAGSFRSRWGRDARPDVRLLTTRMGPE